MTLLLKPKGRGNWNVITMTLMMDRPMDLFAVKPGELIRIGEREFRVIEVIA